MIDSFLHTGLDLFLDTTSIVMIVYFATANSFYLIVLVCGFINARRQHLESRLNFIDKLGPMRALTPISILVPAYNEEKSIHASVLSMLQLDYPDFEVIVVNDGAKDDTLGVLIRAFGLVKTDAFLPQILPCAKIRSVYVAPSRPKLVVVDKENGGKADALNAAINFSRHPLICCVDSDSMLDSDGLARVTLPFFEDPDHVIATGGTIAIINGREESAREGRTSFIPWHPLDLVQAVEYLRAFLVGRMGWDFLGCTTIISGAFGVFKKESVVKVGGYAKGSIGEDMELLLRMHAYAIEHHEIYRVHFLPDPVCWTEAPSDMATLGQQRSRWQQGLCDSLWRTRKTMCKRGSGMLGWVGLPYLAIFEVLSAPLELVGYLSIVAGLWIGYTDPWLTGLFFSATLLYGAILNLGAIIIDQLTFERYSDPVDLMKLIIGAMIEQLGFRQIHLYWRLRGIYRWVRGKHAWGEMKRRGLATPRVT